MSDVPDGQSLADTPNDASASGVRSSDHPDARRERPAAQRWLAPGLMFLRIGPAIGLLLLIIVMSQLTPVFLTPRNIGNLLAQSAVICVLAMGQLLVIVTRGIDLSVGSTLALGTVVGALAFTGGAPTSVVVVSMLLTGVAVGAVNGIVFVKGRLPHAFITTLATLSTVDVKFRNVNRQAELLEFRQRSVFTFERRRRNADVSLRADCHDRDTLRLQ